MGIYIPNMEMPISCRKCFCFNEENGDCFCRNGIPSRYKADINSVPDFCELVELIFRESDAEWA